MYDLYLTYREHRSGGRYLSNEPYSDREDEHIDFYPTAILAERDDAGIWADGLMDNQIHGEFDKGDVGHLLVVRYETGDTFGRTSGYWFIEGFYPDRKEADRVEKLILDGNYPGYKPWVGYFERLEGTEVHTFVVQ